MRFLFSVLTPANWTPGDKCVVIPELEPEEVVEKYGEVTTITMQSGKNYMRLVVTPRSRKFASQPLFVF